jgi:hypothetical protein
LARAELVERRVETGAQIIDGESVSGRAAFEVEHDRGEMYAKCRE